MTPDLIEIAEEAWGKPLPDWIHALAINCQRTSQNVVARQLDRSAAMISQVLRRKYDADTARIEERVRGVFLNGCLICPALGELPLQECQDWREKARTFAVGNPLRTRMYRACRTCPVNQKEAVE
jgi:hypothetical protein